MILCQLFVAYSKDLNTSFLGQGSRDVLSVFLQLVNCLFCGNLLALNSYKAESSTLDSFYCTVIGAIFQVLEILNPYKILYYLSTLQKLDSMSYFLKILSESRK